MVLEVKFVCFIKGSKKFMYVLNELLPAKGREKPMCSAINAFHLNKSVLLR